MDSDGVEGLGTLRLEGPARLLTSRRIEPAGVGRAARLYSEKPSGCVDRRSRVLEL
jgi:hypothetical protein